MRPEIPRSRRPRAPQSRSHYLTPAELARLWKAAALLDEPVWRDLARFLIAIPCRRGEAARLDWSHIDLAAAEWRQPSHMTKNRDPHRLHLNALALDVLQARKAATGGRGLVFPAPKSGNVVDTFSDIKAALMDATKLGMASKAAALTGWTWHDFRRSFATALGEAGIPEAVADASTESPSVGDARRRVGRISARQPMARTGQGNGIVGAAVGRCHRATGADAEVVQLQTPIS